MGRWGELEEEGGALGLAGTGPGGGEVWLFSM